MELYVQYKDYNWMMAFTEKLLERICIAVASLSPPDEKRVMT